MKLKYLAPLFVLGLYACSVKVSEITPVGGPPTWVTATAPAVTAPPTSTLAPTSSPLGDLGLTGRLLYTQGVEGLWQIDLETGESTHLWDIPERAFLNGVAASPDGARLALAYAPPPPEGTPQLGATDIYLAAADCASRPEGCAFDLQFLLERTVQYESFSNPTWSPDGEWLYFTHSRPEQDEQGQITGVSLTIERMAVEAAAAPGGSPLPATARAADMEAAAAPEVVVENGQQLSLSADGSRLAYILFDFETFTQSLWVANAECVSLPEGCGSQATELVPSTALYALAGPQLSPDGTTVAFSASGQLSASDPGGSLLLGVLTDWLGVNTVQAHGPPWEIWTVPAAGGQLTQLTQMFTDSPWPAWSPDGDHMAMLYPGGVVLIGEGDPIFLGNASGHGELIWIP